jgi:predicted rRNA methylase YqxC with S4 and FtsJ domains
MTARYEYKVVQVREGLIGDKVSTGKLEKVMNEHAREGWQVKAVTAADVKGRIGPGSTEGLIVTLERPVA